jgi:hypothetical protein
MQSSFVGWKTTAEDFRCLRRLGVLSQQSQSSRPVACAALPRDERKLAVRAHGTPTENDDQQLGTPARELDNTRHSMPSFR